MNVFFFDIEMVPDTESAQKLYALDGLSDEALEKEAEPHRWQFLKAWRRADAE